MPRRSRPSRWWSNSYQYSPRVNSLVSENSESIATFKPSLQCRASLRRNTVLHKAKIARRMQLKILICRAVATLFGVVHFRQITSALRKVALHVSFTRSSAFAQQLIDGAMRLVDGGVGVRAASGIGICNADAPKSSTPFDVRSFC